MANKKIETLFAVEEKAGEQKINIIRVVAIAVFFIDELVNYYWLGAVEARIHIRTVWTLAAWEALALFAWSHVNLRGHYGRWMKYAFTGVDAIFLTFIIIALEANSGPLISLFYLLIAQSALRYSKPAIYTVTGLSAAGYAAVWWSSFGNSGIPSVSTYVAGIHILAMLVMGVIVGYVVKKMRGLVNKFADNLLRKELAENALSRYVSHQVARQILDSPDGGAIMKAGRRTHVAILFSDIRGFTPMSEAMEPEALLKLLNAYFRRMVDIVFKHNGTLDKFVGDALIVVFNDPFDQPDAEKRAVICAAEMQKEIARFNAEQAAAGQRTLGVGIGVHCGTVIAGNVGSESRMDYTVMGDTVNFTSRLQGKAPAGAVYVSSAVQAKTQADFTYRSLGKMDFKGYSEPAEIHELVN
ncbi:MAG TPA: adenylate/guanylate cyclase domain-containing protein [Elusimicrobiales bacterium]|nr:adenylate/guanylate cyclase domain-containing protein [Elusimicrobiales bacterium]